MAISSCCIGYGLRVQVQQPVAQRSHCKVKMAWLLLQEAPQDPRATGSRSSPDLMNLPLTKP